MTIFILTHGLKKIGGVIIDVMVYDCISDIQENVYRKYTRSYCFSSAVDKKRKAYFTLPPIYPF
jgi:hypothetical protein